MGWKNIYKRRVKVFAVALMIYLDYKAVQKKVKWSSKEKADALWEKTHEQNATRLQSDNRAGRFVGKVSNICPLEQMYFQRPIYFSSGSCKTLFLPVLSKRFTKQ
ncbi:hypothetical protein HPP92_028377 [Vanilla planifolia]|uniref:Uncharacterized protein n=1 Tax=Vanilla planifolia TaxID=51239 RepID=A0A835P5J6_VANPL|nr:hypothetical protein HPP92_028377 [Vanilla planifolia]